jgi:hypothetical protein
MANVRTLSPGAPVEIIVGTFLLYALLGECLLHLFLRRSHLGDVP